MLVEIDGKAKQRLLRLAVSCGDCARIVAPSGCLSLCDI